ncbi:MAG: HK97 gp10 family phage protein [Patescibacteria group bacterium]|nr:HK97 gp10 family phage protein [Patescibacteria group bacterium]
MSESVFQPNTTGLNALATELRGAGERAANDVYRVLRRWGQEYKRRVQRVVPVRFGTLRQSFQVIEENDGHTLAVTLGTSLKSDDGKPYPVYLEFGTDHIAGGKVKGWQPGDAPIMEWPAKMEDIHNFRIDRDIRHSRGVYGPYTERAAGPVGSKKFERAVNIATRAFTAGQGEQMPFMRPVGYEIAPRVIEDCRVAIRDGFVAVMRGKRF